MPVILSGSPAQRDRYIARVPAWCTLRRSPDTANRESTVHGFESDRPGHLHRLRGVPLSTYAGSALVEMYGDGGSVVTARAPGRINLIGEHTDYNDGFVLPVTIGRFVEVAVRRRADDQVRLFAADLEETFEGRLGGDPGHLLSNWRNYLWGLAEELRRQGRVTTGFDLAVRGIIPVGAGLSSSAALEIAATLAFERVFGFELHPLEMVHLCRDVEHRWAGVRCGVMDQMACRLGRPDEALLIDCRDLSHRSVPLGLEGHALVIIDSGVRRELGQTSYNRRRSECEQGALLLGRQVPEVTALRDVDAAMLEAHGGDLPPEILARCRHVVAENARVPAAAAALEAGDLAGFGALMDESHASLRDLFEASHLVVDEMVAEARRTPGVLGARLTGAGFGGSIVALCDAEGATKIFDRMEVQFAMHGVRGAVMMAGPAVAAEVLEDEG